MSYDDQQPPVAQPLPPQGQPPYGQPPYGPPPPGHRPGSPQDGLVMALGIAGLVLGISALLFSMIPCFGYWAVYPGGIAAVLSGVAVFVAYSKPAANGGLAVAALIISLLAVSKGAYEWSFADRVQRGAKSAVKQIQDNAEKQLKRQQEELQKRNQRK